MATKFDFSFKNPTDEASEIDIMSAVSVTSRKSKRFRTTTPYAATYPKGTTFIFRYSAGESIYLIGAESTPEEIANYFSGLNIGTFSIYASNAVDGTIYDIVSSYEYSEFQIDLSVTVVGLLYFQGILGQKVTITPEYTNTGIGFIEFDFQLNKESGFNTNTQGQIIIKTGILSSAGSDFFLSLKGDKFYLYRGSPLAPIEYPLTGLSGSIRTLRIDWTAGGAFILSIDGNPLVGTVVGLASSISSGLTEIGGFTLAQTYLSDFLLWNLNINNEHTYDAQPDGNLNPAWVDTTGTRNGTVLDAPSTIDI